jgi:hypothetical protein
MSESVAGRRRQREKLIQSTMPAQNLRLDREFIASACKSSWNAELEICSTSTIEALLSRR